MDRVATARAEEMLRLLASAAAAARLYPPNSDIPREALDRFVGFANTATAALGQLRYTVEPHWFRDGDTAMGAGASAVMTLAEALHSMQAGQLVVAPDITRDEAAEFIRVVNLEPLSVRQSGGLRAALGAAGVSRLAVIEVTLRASEGQGLLGVDLTAAPLDEIAACTAAAAERWADEASGGQATDEMSQALGQLEDATRALAMQRVAQALMRLDERTRERVLSAALVPDTAGNRMSGCLAVIARMNPASLARLIALTADRMGADPAHLLPGMDLPPEVLEQVMRLISPSPRSEADCGVPAQVDAAAITADLGGDDDRPEIERQVALAAPQHATGRALVTTVRVSRTHATEETVAAIGHALPGATRDGALVEVREALRRLDELREVPALTEASDRARATLADQALLRELCRAPLTDADAAVAGEILAAAGPAGAQALLESFTTTDEYRRSLMRPALRSMSDQILNVASRLLRGESADLASAVLKTLPHLGDRRAVPVIAAALENVDATVRESALGALAGSGSAEAVQVLAKSLSHWDPGTRRHAARELGRIRATDALPALLRVLDEIQLFERNYELKKEVIRSVEAIGSPRAIPVLKRVASVGWPYGRKHKELRFLARNAISRLSEAEEERS